MSNRSHHDQHYHGTHDHYSDALAHPPAQEEKNEKLVGPAPPGKRRIHSRESPAYPPWPNTLQLIPPPLHLLPQDRFESLSRLPQIGNEPSPQPFLHPWETQGTLNKLAQRLAGELSVARQLVVAFDQGSVDPQTLVNALCRVEYTRVQLFVYAAAFQTQTPGLLIRLVEAQEKRDIDFLNHQGRLVHYNPSAMPPSSVPWLLQPLFAAMSYRTTLLLDFMHMASAAAPGDALLDNNNFQSIANYFGVTAPPLPPTIPTDNTMPQEWAKMIREMLSRR